MGAVQAGVIPPCFEAEFLKESAEKLIDFLGQLCPVSGINTLQDSWTAVS